MKIRLGKCTSTHIIDRESEWKMFKLYHQKSVWVQKETF